MQHMLTEFFWLLLQAMMGGLSTVSIILPDIPVSLQLQRPIAMITDHTGQAKVLLLNSQLQELASTLPAGTTPIQQNREHRWHAHMSAEQQRL